MIVGVDLDVATVESDLYWIRWLDEIAETFQSPHLTLLKMIDEYGHGNVPYDLSEVYEGKLGNIRAIEFWKSHNLYDNMFPKPHAKDTLQILNSFGHEIVFVSSIKGSHGKSKHNFIMKHFPYTKGVVFTKEKHYVGVDVMIDDRVDILEKFSSNVTTLQIDSPYKQFSNFTPTLKTDWNGVYEWFKGKSH